MTDLVHLERQLARLRDQHAILGARHPTPAELAGQDDADKATARRIHQARPGVPPQHILAVLHALRAVQEMEPAEPGYCPSCGRGDCAPTADEYEQQRQRAEQAEAALARVRALVERWRYTGDRKGSPASELRAALDEPAPAAGQAAERDCLFTRDNCRPCPASDRCATCDPAPVAGQATDTKEQPGA